MIKVLKQAKKVGICTGASCRAWDSEEIARELRQYWNIAAKQKEFKICRVPCLNRCGGGVSVQISSCGAVLKIRKPQKAMKIVA